MQIYIELVKPKIENSFFVMSFETFIERKKNFKLIPNDLYENLYKGACVKIKNSQKTYQVIGINPERKVCWLREWPFALKVNKTFPLEFNQIIIQTLCSQGFIEK